MAKIVPTSEIRHRLPQIGRIRSGRSVPGKKGQKRPSKSETWILSARRADVLEPLAARYGGEVELWDEPSTDDTHRVITESDWLEVALPPEPLGEPGYVLYKGRRLTRRCDGVICTGYPENGPSVEVDCLCLQIDDESKRPCRPRTHLSVLLPEATIGQWRLVTSSAYAQSELYASAAVILAAASHGLPRAKLVLEQRTQPGKKFAVPVLTSMHSLEELERASQGGSERLSAGRSTETLVAVSETPMALPSGAEIIDAELIEGDEQPW